MPKKENNTVRLKLDFKNPPALTDEQKTRLTTLANLTDEKIDYTDAPYLADAVWVKSADQLPHVKKQITLRIDQEVLDFFKKKGKKYQSRMNAVLLSYVKTHSE